MYTTSLFGGCHTIETDPIVETHSLGELSIECQIVSLQATIAMWEFDQYRNSSKDVYLLELPLEKTISEPYVSKPLSHE